MTRHAIEVEGVSKCYTVSQRPRQGSLRDAMGETVRSLARWTGGRRTSEADLERARQRTFWALRDVSFAIKPGERVAIVGRNGAGKSTLLKLLSRITSPTQGRITIRGRVSSLLEVGTGFHPDLTGRENIYMNGAILGMTRAEIRSKFDAIVTFAEVERFLDTPVKRYSSGMGVRLAFAVAAHLDPEILIVDEVLSVGDAEFQRKCIGKMQEVSSGGSTGSRTVLFVSHSMAAVQALCTSGILMQRGQVAYVGPVQEVVERYISGIKTARLEEGSVDGPDFELVSVAATDGDNGPLQTFRPAKIEVTFRPKHRVIDAGVHILVEDPVGSPILGLDSTDFVARRTAGEGELLTCTFDIQSLPLTPGPIRMRVWLKSWAEEIAWEVPKIFELTVEGGSIYGARSIDRQWHGHTSVVATASL